MAHNRPTTAPPITAEKARVERLVIGYFDPGDPGSNPSKDKNFFFNFGNFSTIWIFCEIHSIEYL